MPAANGCRIKREDMLGTRKVSDWNVYKKLNVTISHLFSKSNHMFTPMDSGCYEYDTAIWTFRSSRYDTGFESLIYFFPMRYYQIHLIWHHEISLWTIQPHRNLIYRKGTFPTARQSCYSSLLQNRCQAPVHCDNAGPPTSIPTAVLKSTRTMAPVFSISMFCRHTMATHETRYSVKIGMQTVFDTASSATCYLPVSTHEKSLDHGSGGRRGSQTVRRLWPIIDVLHLRTQLVKVQLCFVGASPYCIFCCLLSGHSYGEICLKLLTNWPHTKWWQTNGVGASHFWQDPHIPSVKIIRR